MAIACRSNYSVADNNQKVVQCTAANPWTKLIDNPRYLVFKLVCTLFIIIFI